MEWKAVIGVILAAAIIVASIGVFTKLYAMFVPQTDQGSINSFNALADAVQELLNNPSAETESITPYYIKSNLILVGFDKSCSSAENDEDCPVTVCSSGDASYRIPKPVKCSDKACLCLFEEKVGNDFKDEKNEPISCRSFEGDIIFTAPLSSDKKGNIGLRRIVSGYCYEHLVIYGKCKEEFGTDNLVIKKEISQNKMNIFISKQELADQPIPEHTIEEGCGILEPAILTCSEASDESCKNKEMYSSCTYEDICQGRTECEPKQSGSIDCACRCTIYEGVEEPYGIN